MHNLAPRSHLPGQMAQPPSVFFVTQAKSLNLGGLPSGLCPFAQHTDHHTYSHADRPRWLPNPPSATLIDIPLLPSSSKQLLDSCDAHLLARSLRPPTQSQAIDSAAAMAAAMASEAASITNSKGDCFNSSPAHMACLNLANQSRQRSISIMSAASSMIRNNPTAPTDRPPPLLILGTDLWHP